MGMFRNTQMRKLVMWPKFKKWIYPHVSDRCVIFIEKIVFDKFIEPIESFICKFIEDPYYWCKSKVLKHHFWFWKIMSDSYTPWDDSDFRQMEIWHLEWMLYRWKPNYFENQAETEKTIKKAIRLLKRINRHQYGDIAWRAFGKTFVDINKEPFREEWTAEDYRKGGKECDMSWLDTKQEKESVTVHGIVFNNSHDLEDYLINQDIKNCYNYITVNCRRWWL